MPAWTFIVATVLRAVLTVGAMAGRAGAPPDEVERPTAFSRRAHPQLVRYSAFLPLQQEVSINV